jgi:hypothetical protein
MKPLDVENGVRSQGRQRLATRDCTTSNLVVRIMGTIISVAIIAAAPFLDAQTGGGYLSGLALAVSEPAVSACL